MSKKEKSIFTKKILNKNTILGMILLIVWGLFFIEFIGILAVDVPIMIISKITIMGIGAVIFSFLALLIHKRWFFPEFSGCLSCGDVKLALKLSSLFLIYLFLPLLAMILKDGISSLKITLTPAHLVSMIAIACMAGFAEETIFRGVVVSYLMRQWKDKDDRITKIMVLSSVLFGLLHLTNLSVGTNTGHILIQVVETIGMGFFFCAIFLRSGLLWPSIILHTVNDICAFIFISEEVFETPLKFVSSPVNSSRIIAIILCCVLGAMGVFLTRSSKQKEIDDLWAKKWKPICPTTTGFSFRLEEEKDYRRVENMTREAFWNVYRPGCTEHYVINCFRYKSEFVKELDIVMEVYGKIVGHVMFARSEIKSEEKRSVPVVTLGPICIDPQFERKGYGIVLLNYAIEQAASQGFGAIMLEGNPEFYGKAGFVPASKYGIHLADDPESDAPYFMTKILKEEYFDRISGLYSNPEGYFAAEKNPEEFKKYDSSFPTKEKKVLSGQLN